MRLADEFFSAKNDPNQLDVNEAVMAQLHAVHPACVGEYNNENGPAAWSIVIPVTRYVMELFLACQLSKKELFERTLREKEFSALYLCSALVLPEFRRKGIIKNLVLSSLREIQKTYRIQELCCWAFSSEGKQLAEKIAGEARLPIYFRPEK